MNESSLNVKYLVLKVKDINTYLRRDERAELWLLVQKIFKESAEEKEERKI